MKAPTANAGWSGFFVGAGMRYDIQVQGASGRLTSAVGAVNATSGSAIWARRTRQSDGLFDASVLIGFTLNGDGSCAFSPTQGSVTVCSNWQIFASSAVAATDNTSHER